MGKNLCFKRDANGHWQCMAAPIEIVPIKVEGKVSSYSAFVRGKYVGGGRLLAEAKKVGVEAFEGKG